MRKASIRIAAIAAAILAALACGAADDVLYWMVDGSATVDNGGGETSSISSFFSDYGASADSSFAARVRVTGGDISGDTFLALYYSEGGESWMDSGEFGVDFSDIGAGYYGAGVPEGNQSPIGSFSAGSPEYSFVIELGNVVNDGSDNWTWTTVATSAATAYSSLGEFIHQSFDLNPGAIATWSPTTFTAVPEPSGALMSVLGLALLALRRRRFAEER